MKGERTTNLWMSPAKRYLKDGALSRMASSARRVPAPVHAAGLSLLLRLRAGVRPSGSTALGHPGHPGRLGRPSLHQLLPVPAGRGVVGYGCPPATLGPVSGALLDDGEVAVR